MDLLLIIRSLIHKEENKHVIQFRMLVLVIRVSASQHVIYHIRVLELRYENFDVCCIINFFILKFFRDTNQKYKLNLKVNCGQDLGKSKMLKCLGFSGFPYFRASKLIRQKN